MIDEDLIRDFHQYLPNVDDLSVHLLVTGARKKYDRSGELSRSYEVVHRQVIRTNDPEIYINRIKRCIAMFNLSVDTQTGRPLPKSTQVIWSTINPRSTIKACAGLQSKIMKYLESGYLSLLNQKDEYRDNVHQLKKVGKHFLSELQSHATSKRYHICDIDTKDRNTLKSIVDNLGDHVIFATSTKSGYHVVYNRAGNEIVYKTKLKGRFKNVEWFKDRFTPVWGTMQGGHMVTPVGWL